MASAISPAFWQHPFVNLFKLAASGDSNLIRKEGNVVEAVDRDIGKKVFNISGQIPANNYIELPSSKGTPVSGNGLGLTGSFLYLHIRARTPEVFVFHADILTKDDLVLRLSFSNLFKEVKVSPKSVQIPAGFLSDRWTVLALDLREIVRRHTGRSYRCLRNLQFCANMTVRNAYTSDIIYKWEALPRDMYLPVGGGSEWSNLYEWHWLPSEPISSPEQAQAAPSVSSQLQRSGTPSKAPSRSSGSLGDLISTPRSSRTPLQLSNAGNRPTPRSASQDLKAPSTPSLEQQLAAIAGTTPPLLELQQVIGFSGQHRQCLAWSRDGKQIIFAAHSIVVVMEPQTKEQKYFIGHTQPVVCLAVDPSGSLLATAEGGKNPIINLWDLSSSSAQGGKLITTLTSSHSSDIRCISFSTTGKAMATLGRDSYGRNQIILWDTSAPALRTGQIDPVLKQSTDLSLVRLDFVPFEEGQFASCGVDDIRLWRVKRGQLKSRSIDLGRMPPQGFTDLSFEIAFNPENTGHKLYVSSDTGAVVQVDISRRIIERSFQLHDGCISAMRVNEGICVTGGAVDKVVRVWPLDFTDFLMEAPHDGPISSLSISPDGLKVSVGSEMGTIGILSIPTQTYQTVLRSHTADVVDIALNLNQASAEFATVGKDNTVRVWDLDSHDQLYQFDITSGESANCVSYHPAEHTIACGFDSGYVRLMDVETITVMDEYQAHTSPVYDLTFTPDARWLLSSSRASVCVCDVIHAYQPIKAMFLSAPSADAGKLALCASKDGQLLACVGSEGNVIYLYSTATFQEVCRLSSDSMSAGDPFKSVCFSHNSRDVFAISHDGRLVRFSLSLAAAAAGDVSAAANGGVVVGEWGADSAKNPFSISVSSNDRYVAVGSPNGITLFDLKVNKKQKEVVSSAPPQLLGTQCGPAKRVVFLPDSDLFMSTGGSAGGIFVWKFKGATKRDAGEVVDECLEEAERLYKEREDKEQQDNGSPLPNLNDVVSGRAAAMKEASSASSMTAALIRKLREEAEEEALKQRLGLSYELDTYVSQFPSKPIAAAISSSSSASLPPLHPSSSQPQSQTPKQQRRVQINAEEPQQPSSSSSLLLPAKHFSPRASATSPKPSRMFPPPHEEDEILRLDFVMGYNGNGNAAHDNMIWHPESGMFAYSCGANVVIEDLETRQQRILTGHLDDVTVLAYCPVTGLLASASAVDSDQVDHHSAPTILIWDTATSSCRKMLDCHQTCGVQAMEFSQDGSLFLTAGKLSDSSIIVWNNRFEAKATAQLSPSSSPIHSIKWLLQTSANNREFVSTGRSNVTFWLLKDDDQQLMVQEVDFSDPAAVLSPIWRSESSLLPHTPLDFTCAEQHPSDKTLWVGTSTGIVVVFDLDDNRPIAAFQAHEGEIDNISWKEHSMLTSGESPHLCLWTNYIGRSAVVTKNKSSLFNSQPSGLELDGRVSALSFDEHHEQGVVCTAAGSIWFVSLSAKSMVPMVSGHTGSIASLSCNPQKSSAMKSFVTCSEQDKTVRLWSLEARQNVSTLSLPSSSIIPTCAGLDASQQHVAVGSSTGSLYIYSLVSSQPSQSLLFSLDQVTPSSMTQIMFMSSAAGEGLVIVGSQSGHVSVVSVQSQSLISQVEIDGGSICGIDVFGQRFAVTCSSGTVYVFEIDSQSLACECIASFDLPNVNAVLSATVPTLARFSTLDSLIVTGPSAVKAVYTYDLKTSEFVDNYPIPHYATAFDVTQSSSSSSSSAAMLVAFATADRLLSILDTTTGQVQDYCQGASISSLRFVRQQPSERAAEELVLLTGGEEGAILEWNVVQK